MLTFFARQLEPDRRLTRRHARRRERLRDDDEPHRLAHPVRRDLGSGVASSTLTVASAALSNGSVRWLRLRGARRRRRVLGHRRHLLPVHAHGTDKVGNTASVTQTVKVDTTAPSQPSVAFTGLSTGNTFDDRRRHALLPPVGRRRLHRERERLDRCGVRNRGTLHLLTPRLRSLDADRQLLDAPSAGASIGSGSHTVHSTNNAGLDSTDAPYTITADSTAPSGGGLTVNGTAGAAAPTSSYFTSGPSVAHRDDPLQRRRLGHGERDARGRAGHARHDTCSSSARPPTIAAPTYSVANGNCYRFTLTATDRVGNATAVTTIVKVDTTAPVQPASRSAASRAAIRS